MKIFARCMICSSKDDVVVTVTDTDTDTGVVMDVNALEEEIGDMAFVRQIIRETIDDVTEKMTNIERSSSVGDYSAIKMDSHSIKGVALTMKCADLASASSSLETLMNRLVESRRKGRSSDYEGEVPHHVRLLQHEVDRLKKFECTYEKN